MKYDILLSDEVFSTLCKRHEYRAFYRFVIKTLHPLFLDLPKRTR
jgi:hypothetical protein